MRSKFWNHLKDSFLHPTGPRAVAMSLTGSVAGFTAVPVVSGIAAGFLAVSLASGGAAIPLMVGGAVALSTAAVTFAGVLKAGLGKRKDSMLAYPYLAGSILGDAIGWIGYSLRHPVKTYKEISLGQAQQYVSKAAATPDALPQTSALLDKNLKSAADNAFKAPEQAAPQNSAAPDVKKDGPQP